LFVTLLDGKGMVVLSEYIRAEHIATMKKDFLRAKEKMKMSLGGKKYSINYADIWPTDAVGMHYDR
jgi:hypothetical protein